MCGIDYRYFGDGFFKDAMTVASLEDLGRVRLSKNFFLREFLYSETSQIEKIPNIPDYPKIAIEAGKHLCEEVLEPVQAKFGRLSIRSGYRNPKVNAKGAENRHQYNCASNDESFARHIWDYRDRRGCLGATASIVVCSYIDYYEETGDWQSLAWWIHDNVPGYSELCFFPKLCAFNISWHEEPKKIIKSFIEGSKGVLTQPDMDNFAGRHAAFYEDMLRELEK